MDPPIPTLSDSYTVYFVQLSIPPPPPVGILLRAPASHVPRVSHLVGSILLHSRDEDFLRKTANYINEMHAVWSTLDEIARVRRAGPLSHRVSILCIYSFSFILYYHVRERR